MQKDTREENVVEAKVRTSTEMHMELNTTNHTSVSDGKSTTKGDEDGKA
jgi:hypothetical protein